MFPQLSHLIIKVRCGFVLHLDFFSFISTIMSSSYTTSCISFIIFLCLFVVFTINIIVEHLILLEHYIAAVLLEANETNISLFQQIVDKFSELTFGSPYDSFFDKADWIAFDKSKRLKKEYEKRMLLRSQLCKGYIRHQSASVDMGNSHFSIVDVRTFNNYAKAELKQYDALVYFEGTENYFRHQISYEKLKHILFIANNKEEFIVLVKKIAKKV